MSRTVSPSSKKPYGVARVVALWDLTRSSFYAARHRERHPRETQKRGPKVLSDAELVTAIRQLLEEAVFSGEGYRKIWARLRHQGIRASKDRVLQLLRENQLLSPARQPEGNGCIERFFRTLKEQLLWIRHFRDLEELRAALTEFRNRYNHQWILQRLNYRTPVQARHDFTLELQPAA